MTPALRDMQITTATWRAGAWHVALPGNREVAVPDELAVELLVRAEAAGSAVRYLIADDSTPTSAHVSGPSLAARRRAPRRSPITADVPEVAVG